MRTYGLSFINDIDFYNHVLDTVGKYRFEIDLKKFNRNLLDPIKLTFDAKVYDLSIEQLIEREIARQIDKSNTNHIGYFHQNIFRYMGDGWSVPTTGYDLIHEENHLYVEMKNKHNTMNSSSAQRVYTRMQNTLLRDSDATCMLVEVIAKQSQNIPWRVSMDGESFAHDRIRRISIDQFYAIATGIPDAFKQLCESLPQVLEEVIASQEHTLITNTVMAELADISPDLFKSIYLLAFGHYAGFEASNV